jgi:hypothetical protein
MLGEDVTEATTPVEVWIQGSGVYGLFDSAGHLVALPVQVGDVLRAEVVAGDACMLPHGGSVSPVGGLMDDFTLLWCSLKRVSMDRSVLPM